MGQVEVTSFSATRYPLPLAHALARSRTIPDHRHPPQIFPEENDWAASALLVKFLIRARRSRPVLGRERASELLRDAAHELTVSQLESRNLIRFVLGRLEIPGAVQLELRVSRHLEFSEHERAAIALLETAREDRSAFLWLPATEVDEIHRAHLRAHARTPSLASLCDDRVLCRGSHLSEDGYDIILDPRESSPLASDFGALVLGRYWEALIAETSAERDDEHFRRWLNVALHVYWWSQAPRWVRSNLQGRLVEAAKRYILAEPDLLDADREIERIRWDHDGYGFAGRPDFDPIPRDLNDLYDWWQKGPFGDIEQPCREQLDCLVSVVTSYDRDAWANRVVELLEAAPERPYLMYAVTLELLLHNRESVAGVVVGRTTASIGMDLLSRLHVSIESPPGVWEDRREADEALKTEIWRDAVPLLLATLHSELARGGAASAAAVLAATICNANAATRRHATMPAREEIEHRGARARLEMLLAALEQSADAILWPLADDLQRCLEERARRAKHGDGSHGFPIWELHGLFWLLRTTRTRRSSAGASNTATLATTIAAIYFEELARPASSDRGLAWRLDRPSVAALPWCLVLASLHENGRTQELLGPQALDLAHMFHSASERASLADSKSFSEHYDVAVECIHKARLHLEVLIRIHRQALDRQRGSIAPGISEHQWSEVISLVEQRLHVFVRSLVAASKAIDGTRLFDEDSKARSASSSDCLVSLVTGAFNAFSSKIRDRAFADWIDVEDNPYVLLTILREAASYDARQRASAKLTSIDVAQFFKARRWSADIESVAWAAARVREQVELAENVLKLGDERYTRGRNDAWQDFAFRTRLLIAYQKKDLARIEELKAPEGPARALNGDLIEPAEDSRSFYRALLLVDDQPETAKSIFDDLVRRRPRPAAELVNRAWAGIRAAGTLQGPPRRDSFFGVVRELEAALTVVPSADLEVVKSNVAFIRLAAFNGAEDHGSFDAAWERLSDQQRADVEFLALGVDNAHRRDMQDRVSRLLAHARPYHTDHAANVDKRFKEIAERAVTNIGGTVLMRLPTMTPAVGTAHGRLEAVDVREIVEALVRIGLHSSRAALFAGIPSMLEAGLPRCESPSAQCLSDVQRLSSIPSLSDGSSPLRQYLENAALLAGPRPEAEFFTQMSGRMHRR